LEKEIKVIEELGYIDYFLIFSDIVEFLKKKDVIVGPGRGSSVSSLVVYLLDITDIDPVKYDLIFERFLNEKRKSYPDIDLDVENQQEILDYLKSNFPKEQVARIVTRKKIGLKNAFNEITKFFGMSD
jgi:DNA polymerase-3 subunit alpha